MSLQYVRVSAVWRAGAAPADAVTAAAATITTPIANHHLAGLCMCHLLPWLCGNRVEDRLEQACGPVADDVIGGRPVAASASTIAARAAMSSSPAVLSASATTGAGSGFLVEAHDLRKRRDRR